MGSKAATPAGRRRAAARAGHRARGTGAGAAKGDRGHGPRKRPKPPSAPRRSHAGRSSTAAACRRGASGPRWRRRLVGLAAVGAALAAGYFLWLRDSPLFAVEQVRVEGAASDDKGRITAALTRAAAGMTTLHIDHERLEHAVAGFPTVESLHADPSLPRGLVIEVSERPPALAARAGGVEAAVAADGTVLPGIEPPPDLPRVDVERIPEAGRLTEDDLDRALVAAAAPDPLAPLVRRVASSAERGLEARLRGGIVLIFGERTNAAAKWTAAAAVLADPELGAATYIDLRVPQRPAVGGELTAEPMPEDDMLAEPVAVAPEPLVGAGEEPALGAE